MISACLTLVQSCRLWFTAGEDSARAVDSLIGTWLPGPRTSRVLHAGTEGRPVNVVADKQRGAAVHKEPRIACRQYGTSAQIAAEALDPVRLRVGHAGEST